MLSVALQFRWAWISACICEAATAQKKTGTPECVRLMEIPLAILEKYKGMDANGKLLPLLTQESMNIHLKKMAVMCGINRPISFHCGRHINFGSS